MNGFVPHHLQIETYGHSTVDHGKDFAYYNSFQRGGANGKFKFREPLFANTQQSQNDVIGTIGTVSGGGNKWIGSVAFGEYIYGCPQDSLSVFEANIHTGEITQYGNISGATKWQGCVLAGQWMYCIPGSDTRVMKFNVITKEIEYLSGPTLSGSSKWFGGVLLEDGRIYCAPYSSTSILVIDTLSDEYYTFGNVSGSTKFAGACLSFEGNIYFIPKSSTYVLKCDPTTNTLTQFGSLGAGLKWAGGSLSQDGYIYCAPRDATTILKINPFNDSVSTFGAPGAGTNKYISAALAPNGMIYCGVLSAGVGLKINPFDDTISTYGTVAGTLQSFSITLGYDGKLYSVPYGSAAIVTHLTPTLLTQGFVENRRLNKCP